MCLPFDTKPDCSADGVAVGEVFQTGVERGFAIDGVFVVVPVVAAADADAAPQSLWPGLELGAGNVDLACVEELVIEIGDAVEVAAPRLALVVLPGQVAVGGDAEPAAQAVAVVKRDRRAERVGEAVEVDME